MSLLAVNSAVNNLVVVRALGHLTEPMIASFIQVWCCVREHWFGELPEIPRIWVDLIILECFYS